MNKSIKIIIVAIIIIISILIISKIKTNKIEKIINIENNNTSVDYKANDDGGYTIYDTKTNKVVDNVENLVEIKLYQDNPNYSDFSPKLEEPIENANIIQ